MSRDEIDVDARLRRALAHAPDAAIEPPEAIDAAILRAAAARIRQPATPSSGVAGVVTRLKQWWMHPALAPALVVATLSTVIVSLWTRHEVPGAVVERHPVPEVAAQASASAPAAPPQDARMRSPAPAPAATTHAPGAEPVANAVTGASAEAAVPARARKAEDAAPAVDPFALTLDKRAQSSADPRAKTRASEAAPSPRASAAQSTSDAPSSTAMSDAAAREATPRDTPSTGIGSVRAPSALAGAWSRGVPAAETALDELADATDLAWRWRSEGSEAARALPAGQMRSWLSRLASTTRGRWVPSEPRTELRGTVVEILRADALLATVVVGSASVAWTDVSGRRWQAALSPDALDALRTP